MKNYKWLMMAVGAVIITGCGSVLKSTRVDTTKVQQPEDIQQGIPYFLPTGKIRVIATRDAKPIPARSSIDLHLQANLLWDTETNFGVTTPGGFSTNRLVTQLRLTNTFQPQLEERFEYTVRVETVIEPDATAMFALKTAESSFANDSYHIKVSNGLLETINSTNSDQTGEIIQKLAELGAQVFKIASGQIFSGVKPANVLDEDSKVPDFPPSLDLTFNPFEPTELTNAVRELARARLEIAFIGADQIKPGKIDELGKGSRPANGVFFRPALPYQVLVFSRPTPLSSAAAAQYTAARAQQIKHEMTTLAEAMERAGDVSSAGKIKARTSDVDNQVQKAQAAAAAAAPAAEPAGTKLGVLRTTVFLPNRSPVMSYDIRRAALVSKTTKLAFSNGSLVDVSVDKPSQVLAGVKVPLEIAKSVVALPTDLIQLKINIASSNNALLAAQTAQLTALSNQLVAERALDQLRRATNAATTPATNTPAAQ